MSQIVVSSDEFPDIVACYLLQCIIGDDITIDNPLFIQLIERMKNAGLRGNLLHMYLNIDGNLRIKYKYIADTLFNETNIAAVIKVLPNETK